MTDAQTINSFLHFVFLGFVALFPPVNPVGSAVVVEPFLHYLDKKQRMQAAFMIASYCLTLCILSALIGGAFFNFFGISLPVVQMAGGILICKMGWGILNADNEEREKSASVVPADTSKVQSMLFYPLAFPMTTGGGTISVLLALSANSYDPEKLSHTFKMLALITSCVLMALAIFVCYYYAPSILKRLGKQGYQVANRLSGFLTFCVGLQIFVNGLTGIIHSFK